MTAGQPERLDPAAVEQALADQLDDITDAQTRALVAAWVLAWSEVSGALLDTITDLAADGVAITSAAIARTPRLAQALAVIADRLVDLCDQAGIIITTDLPAVVELAVDGQVELMAAQITDRPADPDDADDDGETADERRDRLDIERPPRRTALDAIVERTTERITSQLDPVADEAYEILQRELIRGVVVGDNPRTTARRIVDRAEGDFNGGLNRALVIARTEVLDAYRDAAGAQQAEHADILGGWVWLAHLGPRTCRSCIANHGEVFDLDVEGPIDHQQGRCSRTPLVAEDDGSVDTSWVPDPDEWFASLTVAQQVAILGKAGFKAWQAGTFPRSAWTKRRTTAGWRDSMVVASPSEQQRVIVAG